jgi:hypothetical protein
VPSVEYSEVMSVIRGVGADKIATQFETIVVRSSRPQEYVRKMWKEILGNVMGRKASSSIFVVVVEWRRRRQTTAT